LVNCSNVEITIFRHGGWQKIPSLYYYIDNNPAIDIAILDNGPTKRTELFDVESSGYMLSQECYFLGFPFGLKIEDKTSKLNNGFPIPFVKKGIISSFSTGDPNEIQRIFIDGHNNPGFSGGPVVVENQSGKERKWNIIGVISSYMNESKIAKSPVGDIINQENSGIIISFATNHAIKIIDTIVK
jgi:hypothetical protein